MSPQGDLPSVQRTHVSEAAADSGQTPDPDVRAYLVGKLMRQAKPDDVFAFVSPRTIRDLWPRLERHLGQTRRFWTWLFEVWEAQGRVWR